MLGLYVTEHILYIYEKACQVVPMFYSLRGRRICPYLD
uniref:Uncharacterized protein n=1 Tax=Anguilla anguilla TaxID=7936 RepID=A0A0E9R083_ANGAN